MEPINTKELADYVDRTKSLSRHTLAKLGHRVPLLSPQVSVAKEKSDSEPDPAPGECARTDVIEVRGEASSEIAS